MDYLRKKRNIPASTVRRKRPLERKIIVSVVSVKKGRSLGFNH